MSFFMLRYFFAMRKYDLKKTSKKDSRITIRVSEIFNNYLNKCSEFFGVSKSYLISHI